MANCGFYCVMYAEYSGPNGGGELIGYTDPVLVFEEIAPITLQFVNTDDGGSLQTLVIGGPYATVGEAAVYCGAEHAERSCLPDDTDSSGDIGGGGGGESSVSSSFSYSESVCNGECGITFFGSNIEGDIAYVGYANNGPSVITISNLSADLPEGHGWNVEIDTNPLGGCEQAILTYYPDNPEVDPIAGTTVSFDWSCAEGDYGTASHTF